MVRFTTPICKVSSFREKVNRKLHPYLPDIQLNEDIFEHYMDSIIIIIAQVALNPVENSLSCFLTLEPRLFRLLGLV